MGCDGRSASLLPEILSEALGVIVLSAFVYSFFPHLFIAITAYFWHKSYISVCIYIVNYC